MKRVYLDYAASTPIDSKVLSKMHKTANFFANPSSHHAMGRMAHSLIEEARVEVAKSINANPMQIIWTSGATEANNIAIQGLINSKLANKKKHIITTNIEHPSILGPCKYLATQGFEISYLSSDRHGCIDPLQLKKMLRSDTLLVTIMHVNNEIGSIQDISTAAKIIRKYSTALLHVDAAQSLGKLVIDAKDIDLMSLSGHKIYGPKGIGALYISDIEQANIQALSKGGEQELGIRSGTLPTQQIIGMGEACSLLNNSHFWKTTLPRIKELRDYLWQGLQTLPGIKLNGDLNKMVATHLNATFSSKTRLLDSLSELMLSAGSACMGTNITPSYVLLAMGLTDADINNSIRFSLGKFTTKEEIDFVVELIKTRLNKIG